MYDLRFTMYDVKKFNIFKINNANTPCPISFGEGVGGEAS